MIKSTESEKRNAGNTGGEKAIRINYCENSDNETNHQVNEIEPILIKLEKDTVYRVT